MALQFLKNFIWKDLYIHIVQKAWFPSLEVTSVPGVLYNFTENIMYMLK